MRSWCVPNGYYQAGYHNLQWDAANQAGEKVASGFYFYRLQSGDFHQVRKMLLLK
jgi:flagellar hook assembly protein FlgD